MPHEPVWGDGLPICPREECSEYDGKRCRMMGSRPSRFCEPALIAMVGHLNELRMALKPLAALAPAYRNVLDGAAIITVSVPDPMSMRSVKLLLGNLTQLPKPSCEEWYPQRGDLNAPDWVSMFTGWQRLRPSASEDQCQIFDQM